VSNLSQLSGKELERIARNINPGGWAIESDKPIATLLGSCVAVCLFDPQLKLGGMNHFLLPSRTTASHSDTDATLSGDFAMEVLVNGLLNKGVNKNRLVAKAFGGGTIVSLTGMAIGARNAEFAQEWLDREGIPLIASDFSGPWSRKVVFLPENGDAFCRRRPTTQADAAEVVKAEMDYENSLALPKQTKEKRIELF